MRTQDGKRHTNVHQLKESVFVVIGVDGATNFGIIKGNDGSAILIDADIRRMEEIDDALISILRKAVGP